MKSKAIGCVLVAICSLVAATSALAQMEGDANEKNLPILKPRADVRAAQRVEELSRRNNERQARDAAREEQANARRERRYNEPGAGPDQRFHRGDQLPAEYRGRQYVVDDWRGHHLRSPPRGYHWVQNGADYMLVAVATGLIAEVLLNQ